MSTKETPFAISAVTHLTGISPHTLRKWESRYSVVQPKRTPSGRRVYTQSDVDKLALLKALVAQGHPISVLSSLSDAELQALQHQLPEIKESGPADQIIVVGHMLTATLKREPLQHDNVELLATDARQWLADGEPRGEPGSRALVVELSTVEATDANQLARAASDPEETGQLGEAIGEADLQPARCREVLGEVVDALQQLRVSTLDSYFNQVATSFSLELRLPMPWQMIDDIQTAELKREAIRRVVNQGN